MAVQCQPGELIVSGGVMNLPPGWTILESAPYLDNEGDYTNNDGDVPNFWQFTFNGPSTSGPYDLTVFAVCLQIS